MKIYIPYKHTTGEELRFALRSIDKNLSGYEDVILITDRVPDWYKGNIIFYKDVSDRKQLNIISKLFEIKDEKFILWNDDHFLIKQLQVNEIKNWYEGTLSEALGKAHGKYYPAVRNTIDHFGDVKNFDIHLPAILSSEQIHRVFRLEWADKEFIIKSAALNSQEGEETKDMKIDRPISVEAIENLVKERLFFSTGPSGLGNQMVKFLTDKFPEKSMWEK